MRIHNAYTQAVLVLFKYVFTLQILIKNTQMCAKINLKMH